jgi:hypothetical protein
MRRKIQIGSLWVLIFTVFAFFMTVFEMFFIGGLMPVLNCIKDIMGTAMLVFVVSSWWNTICHFFKRVTRTLV